MKKILVSGLINTETTVKVKSFPIEYFPIDYPFFGVNTRVSGVAYNLVKALKSLGDDVSLVTMTGDDFSAEYIKTEVEKAGVDTKHISNMLKETPNSVVLYDNEGKRQIYCDLKDIQDIKYDFEETLYNHSDVVIACNTNFNRELLKKAKAAGKMIATDVHVLGDIDDEYNQDFMKYANILFLSDENIEADYKKFILSIEEKFGNDIIVLGMGKKGALMYVKDENKFYELPAVDVKEVVNTVGAGDALFSSFIHFYAKGLKPIECLKRAEVFAAYKIGFDGASVGFTDEETVEKLVKEL
ncbi:MAG: carbohydrate kinase family protein [Lachnospiraceae bacterium]|nr:carbohydrate kinase family protein [Lachnospiraceae bacterium]MBQ3545473.1 carbohydrate kinase family protein [Lachnospiraceae bacterium]